MFVLDNLGFFGCCGVGVIQGFRYFVIFGLVFVCWVCG